MKKTISIILTIVMVMSLFGCNTTETNDHSETTLDTSVNETVADNTEATDSTDTVVDNAETTDGTEVTEPVETEPTETEPVETTEEPSTEPATEPTETQPAVTEHKHSYSSKTTKPTCESKGYTTYTCACGRSYNSNETKATGHSYKTETIAPTAESKGYDLHTCTKCGASYKDNYKDKLSAPTEPPVTEPPVTEHTHNYKAVVTAPTCEEHGYTTYTCTCGDSYTADTTYPTGHAYRVTETVAPTANAKGYDVYTCEYCKDSYKDNYTELPSSHDHSWGEWVCDDNGSTRTCTTCNYTQVVDGSTSVAVPEVVELINEYRVEAGLVPLEYDWDAQKLANIRAQESEYLFDHSRPNGKGISSLCRPYKMSGECIAGFSTAKGAVDAWRRSTSGHWNAIMNPDYTRAVVACSENGNTVILLGYPEDWY